MSKRRCVQHGRATWRLLLFCTAGALHSQLCNPPPPPTLTPLPPPLYFNKEGLKLPRSTPSYHCKNTRTCLSVLPCLCHYPVWDANVDIGNSFSINFYVNRVLSGQILTVLQIFTSFGSNIIMFVPFFLGKRSRGSYYRLYAGLGALGDTRVSASMFSMCTLRQ